jgi:hypothetical protein
MIIVLITFTNLLFSFLIGAAPTAKGIESLSAQPSLCCVRAIDELYIDDVRGFLASQCNGFKVCLQNATPEFDWCRYCLIIDPSDARCLTGTWPPVGKPPSTVGHRALDVDLDSVNKELESAGTDIALP